MTHATRNAKNTILCWNIDERGDPLAILNQPGRVHADALANAIVPQGEGDSQEWYQRVRSVLADVIRQLQAQHLLSAEAVRFYVQAAPFDELKELLAGTQSAAVLASVRTFGALRTIASACVNAELPQVALVPWPDTANLSARYQRTALASDATVRDMPLVWRCEAVMAQALELIVVDGCNPLCVHNTLLELYEYQSSVGPKMRKPLGAHAPVQRDPRT